MADELRHDRRGDDYWKGQIASELKAIRDLFASELRAIRDLLDREIDHQGKRMTSLESRTSVLETRMTELWVKVAVMAVLMGVLGAKLGNLISW